jgi:hypothetical protein
VATQRVIERFDVVKYLAPNFFRDGEDGRSISSFFSVAKNVSATAFAFAVNCA